MKIRFDDTPFRAAHGKAPRGRGCWAFAATKNPAMEEVVFSPSMTLTEAKKWFCRTTVAGPTAPAVVVVYVLS